MTGHVERPSRFVADPDSVSASLPTETAILSRRDGGYFGLTEVGARIWQLLQRPRSVDEIVASITAEYDVPPDRCRGDVEELLRELGETGLVTRCPADSDDAHDAGVADVADRDDANA